MGFELVAGDIKHHRIRETLFDVNADGLGDMGFPEAGAAEQEQRIERGFARSQGNVFSGVDAQFVAVPFHQVAEAVYRVQPRVDLEPLYARIYEGAGAA